MADEKTDKKNLTQWLSQVFQGFNPFITDTKTPTEPLENDTLIENEKLLPKSTYASLVEGAFEKQLYASTPLSLASQKIESDLPMQSQVTENRQEDEEDTFVYENDHTSPSGP